MGLGGKRGKAGNAAFAPYGHGGRCRTNRADTATLFRCLKVRTGTIDGLHTAIG
ncbi:hypothetical protein [Treponema endosymbiont of Eucomonympha sp.]|uniref:hypothetical protein n=1 Tax=Treponema endosymbiont of Eucomonympha sp. TaxID=1580831 RepID=UPI000AAE85CA|nr:hypothetical protein [Treponema endosymbiont of Eucomonympha sp.]